MPGDPSINFNSASKNVASTNAKVMGQRNFFTGDEHNKFNSHWKRQEFLKG